MSALPPKADIVQHDRDVRFVPKADIQAARVPLIACTSLALQFPHGRLYRSNITMESGRRIVAGPTCVEKL